MEVWRQLPRRSTVGRSRQSRACLLPGGWNGMLQVRMFGSIEIVDPDGGRVLGPRDLGGKKHRQLLEILLLERGGRVSKQRLAEAIGLVQGQLLEDDSYAEWVQDAREAHMPRLMGALVSAGECALTLGDSNGALRFAALALARDSLVEAASRIAMVASYR